jgi:hypothetical protein
LGDLGTRIKIILGDKPATLKIKTYNENKNAKMKFFLCWVSSPKGVGEMWR